VRHLVPERGLPVEIAWRPRARRVEGDHAAEAGAEGAEEARQAQGADGEVVVFREDLDEDGPPRFEAVARGHLRHGVLHHGHGVVPERRSLVWIELDRHGSGLDRLEPVQRVEHLQQVVRDEVVRVGSKRRFERAPRAAFVTDTEQVQAEIRVRPRVVGFERHGLPRQRHRVLVPVVARCAGRNDAVEIAVDRIGGEGLRDGGVVVGCPAGHVGEGGAKRMRLGAVRVRGERACQVFLRLGDPVGVEGLAGEEDVGFDKRRIDFNRAARGRDGRRRVLVRQRLREPGVRWSPKAVGV
jgi:hypothetical protein